MSVVPTAVVFSEGQLSRSLSIARRASQIHADAITRQIQPLTEAAKWTYVPIIRDAITCYFRRTNEQLTT